MTGDERHHPTPTPDGDHPGPSSDDEEAPVEAERLRGAPPKLPDDEAPSDNGS